MSDMPGFNFKSTGFNSQNEVMEAAGFSKGGKFFDEGEYSLQIIEAQLDGVDKFDPTWIQVKLTLSDGEKSIKHWLKVPTDKIQYNEGDNKYPLSEFLKLQNFMGCLGEELGVTAESLGSILPKYFTDTSALVEKIVGVAIGYYGNHIAYTDGKYSIVDKKGEPLSDETFDQRGEAEGNAEAAGIRLQKFAKILKFIKPESKWE